MAYVTYHIYGLPLTSDFPMCAICHVLYSGVFVHDAAPLPWGKLRLSFWLGLAPRLCAGPHAMAYQIP